MLFEPRLGFVDDFIEIAFVKKLQLSASDYFYDNSIYFFQITQKNSQLLIAHFNL